ncbi:MAG: ATP-grasp fold amidoligase family protein [Syntrophomonas sp.]
MNNTLKNLLLMPMNILYRINPALELKILFYFKKRYKLNLSNPVTYSEKLNWIKIYYKHELFPICADKYTVRQYIEDCGYKDLLNELLWEGFDANEIPFDKLPQQFVIKVTHGSGLNIICKNKDELDINRTVKTLNKWLKQKYLLCYGEWFYGKVRPRIIIEEFLSEDGDTLPVDYKLYYFNDINGSPGIGFSGVHTDRFKHHKMTLYDADWNKMSGVTWGYPFEEGYLAKPQNYDEMVEITKILAKPFLHVRIDFYIIKDKLYLGEITFTCSAGYAKIQPYEFDAKLGSWIKLPDKNTLGVNV